MDFDVRPEPSPAERAALAVALERLLAREDAADTAPAYRSKWRQVGLRENVASDVDAGGHGSRRE